MPKGLQALKYGDKTFVTDSNPGWERYLPDNPMTNPKDSPKPPAPFPLDLHYLSQQAFAHDKQAMKRWFLTAFVPPEDRYLLTPPADTIPTTQVLNAIKQALEQPAKHCTPTHVSSVQQRVIALFKQDKWLGVALQMVDNKALSIDILNTLIQWQSLVTQFGEPFFSLETVADKPFETYLTPDINQSTAHHFIYAQSTLTLEEIQTTDWGKEVERLWAARKSEDWKDWKPSLENFQSNLIDLYSIINSDLKALCIRSPSTVMLEHHLLNKVSPSHITPLYSFGYLIFEDFCAAALFAGRPIQHHLPSAKGNLYWAHGKYYPHILMALHDLYHVHFYEGADKPTFQLDMRILAIIANALIKINQTSTANAMVDDGVIREVAFLTTPQQRASVFTAIYNEFALASGITLEETFSYKNEEENNRFWMKARYQGKPLSFLVEVSNSSDPYLEDFRTAFKQIQTLVSAPPTHTTHGYNTRYAALNQHKKLKISTQEPSLKISQPYI